MRFFACRAAVRRKHTDRKVADRAFFLCGGDDRTVREERVVDTAVIDTCNGKAALTVGDLLETEAVKLRLFAEVNHGIPDIIAFAPGLANRVKRK